MTLLSWWQSKIFWLACGAAEAVTGLARLTVPPWGSRYIRYIRYKIVFVIKIVTLVTVITQIRIELAPGRTLTDSVAVLEAVLPSSIFQGVWAAWQKFARPLRGRQPAVLLL